MRCLQIWIILKGLSGKVGTLWLGLKLLRNILGIFTKFRKDTN